MASHFICTPTEKRDIVRVGNSPLGQTTTRHELMPLVQPQHHDRVKGLQVNQRTTANICFSANDKAIPFHIIAVQHA